MIAYSVELAAKLAVCEAVNALVEAETDPVKKEALKAEASAVARRYWDAV